MQNRYRLLLAIAAILTFAYLMGLGLNLTPYLRGPDEWRWAYAIPGRASRARLWLPAIALAVYVWLCYKLTRRPMTPVQRALALTAAALMTTIGQLALMYMDHPDARPQLFYQTVSEQSGGFFNVGAAVTDGQEFLRQFPEQMPYYPIHPQRHPPGVPLLFAWTRQLFDKHTSIADKIGAVFRPYQCHNLPLMSMPNSAIASATLQMLMPAWLSAIVWPLYLLGRTIYDKDTGVRAALLWPLLPSVALWIARWNQLYAAFTILALLCFHQGLNRRNKSLVLLSGITVSIASFFSFGNFAIAGILGIYALVWLRFSPSKRPRFWWLAISALLLALGVASLWVFVWLAYGLNLIDIWQAAMRVHLSLNRSYATWLFYHLYDFFVFLGIPLFVLWLVHVGTTIHNLAQKKRANILVLTSAAVLLTLDISGMAQGEVARVWAFLLPLALLSAANHIKNKTPVFTYILALLACQTFVSNIFLRPVGTGLSAPPPQPPAATVDIDQIPLATWDGGITLWSTQVPDTATAGQSIDIDVTWSTDRQISLPYTIFVHLTDPQGNLVAQADGMPLDGNWPTTCWKPGQAFNDHYTLVIPHTPGDTYQVQIGIYWLSTGERLPVVGPNADGAQRVTIGTVAVDGIDNQ